MDPTLTGSIYNDQALADMATVREVLIGFTHNDPDAMAEKVVVELYRKGRLHAVI